MKHVIKVDQYYFTLICTEANEKALFLLPVGDYNTGDKITFKTSRTEMTKTFEIVSIRKNKKDLSIAKQADFGQLENDILVTMSFCG